MIFKSTIDKLKRCNLKKWNLIKSVSKIEMKLYQVQWKWDSLIILLGIQLRLCRKPKTFY